MIDAIPFVKRRLLFENNALSLEAYIPRVYLLCNQRQDDVCWAIYRLFGGIISFANAKIGISSSAIDAAPTLIECQGQARPLLRCDESYAAKVENNRLTNVSDTERYDNPQTGRRAGLEEPLEFQCGVHGEYTVDGWKVRRTAR